MVSIIRIHGPCNQNCIFCCQRNSLKSQFSDSSPNFDHYCDLIRKETGAVILSGCETTIYPKIFDLISLAKKRKISFIELQSNGLTFSYKKWAKRFFDLGLTEFNINFPSHIEKTNDTLTRTRGTLKKRIQGIKNLEEMGANLRITYVINSLNYKEMPSFVEFVEKNFKDTRVIFTYIQNAGNVRVNTWLMPKYSEISDFLQRAIQKASSKDSFLVEGVPLCFLGDHMGASISYNKILGGKTFFPIPSKKIEACKLCDKNHLCKGVPEDYLEVFGAEEFKNCCVSKTQKV